MRSLVPLLPYFMHCVHCDFLPLPFTFPASSLFDHFMSSFLLQEYEKLHLNVIPIVVTLKLLQTYFIQRSSIKVKNWTLFTTASLHFAKNLNMHSLPSPPSYYLVFVKYSDFPQISPSLIHSFKNSLRLINCEDYM